MFENTATTGIKFNNLLSLKILEKLGSGLNFDFTALENLIVDSTQNTQTAIALLSTEIEELKTLVQGQQPAQGLTFTPIALTPTYQTFANNNWNVSPQNLQAIYDADDSSASNLFYVHSGFDVHGGIIMFPGVSIPQFTKVEIKIGLRNSNNNRALFELQAFNIALSSYVGIWAYFESASATNDLIANVNVIVPFSWDKLRFRMSEFSWGYPMARFYDLKVWEVS